MNVIKKVLFIISKVQGYPTFLVKWGGVAPRSESSNQIAERVIIGDDVAIEHEI